jgi:hypothetical protein
MPKPPRSDSGRPSVGVAAIVVGVAAWLVLVHRIESARRAIRSAVLGGEVRMRELLDELCVAAHTLGEAAARRADVPDLAAEADEAHDRAEREERGEVAPTKGHRAHRKAG